MPKISKCLRGFNRDQLFGGFLANLVNKVVNRPFYNPDYRGDEKDVLEKNEMVRFRYGAMHERITKFDFD